MMARQNRQSKQRHPRRQSPPLAAEIQLPRLFQVEDMDIFSSLQIMRAAHHRKE
jgi:hypothetical protein